MTAPSAQSAFTADSPAAAPLASMTAFARSGGASGPWRFAWEVRSVNGKGLDVRLRLPPGFDAVETEVRARTGRALSRGSLSATLTASREGEQVAVSVNQPALDALYRAVAENAARLGAPVPGLDALLTVKGIVEVREADDSEAERQTLISAVLDAFDSGLTALGAMREREGEALRVVLAQRLDTIADLIATAETLPDRTLEAMRARLAEQVSALIDTGQPLDPDRLHQEAVLVATRADVREELDRLGAHLAAARDLIAKGGPVGRRLDFLAQEFNREANTLCSKSNSIALTKIGLDLKLLVDQFREQLQNLE